MITGTTGGLGTAFSAECASRGYDLLLTDMVKDGAEFSGTLAKKYGVRVKYKTCNLTSEVDRTALFKTLEAEGICLWGLINNAGMGYQGAFQSLTRQKVLQVIRLNAESAIDNT